MYSLSFGWLERNSKASSGRHNTSKELVQKIAAGGSKEAGAAAVASKIRLATLHFGAQNSFCDGRKLAKIGASPYEVVSPQNPEMKSPGDL